MYRLALLSVHGCPVARLGEKDSGGMNVYVLQIARELGRLGNTVDVYTRYQDPSDPQIVEIGENARVIHLKAGPYFETKESLSRYIPEFLGNLYRFQKSEGISYDLIHSHYWLSGCAGLELSARWRVPHVATFHTLALTKLGARAGEEEPQLRVSAESQVMKAVDSIVVSTEEERNNVTRLYHVSPHKVRVIPAGVDLKMFTPTGRARARQSLGLTEDKIILSVSRIEPLKGLDILIGAVAMLQDHRNTRLVIVGGDPGRNGAMKRLGSMAATLGISDMVTFTGAVDHARIPTYLSAADVFVIPSYHESFGLAALEAMACGIPVVACRVGGLKTFITNGETGYLIPWHCPEPFTQRLEMLLANPALRESIGGAARATAQKMDWSITAREIVNLYDRLTGAALQSVAGA